MPLKVWIYLARKRLCKERIYIENIYDTEEDKKILKKKINGIAKRFIIDIDFENKFIRVQGWENWTNKMEFKDYGKTWSLDKQELEK